MEQKFRARSHHIFYPYKINETLIELAKPSALFMHFFPLITVKKLPIL